MPESPFRNRSCRTGGAANPASPPKQRSRRTAAAPGPMAGQIETALVSEHHRAMLQNDGSTQGTRSGVPLEVRHEVDHVISRFAPPHVIIDSDYAVLEIHGNAGRYFELAPGRASLNLLTMLREGLAKPLRATLYAANLCGTAVRTANIKVKTNDGPERIDIEATPLSAHGKTWFVVVFDTAQESLGAAQSRSKGKARPDVANIELRRELARLQMSLRAAIEEQECTNGELQSANEEVQAANEELQSINEELEVSREQLQSSNDQLLSVNEDLLNRSIELHALNAELASLLASAQIAIVLVDTELRIKHFTSSAQHMFNLIPADVGRPLQDLSLVFSGTDLHAQLRDVIESGANKRFDVQDRTGSHYSMRLQPYLNEGNKIDGASIVTMGAA